MSAGRFFVQGLNLRAGARVELPEETAKQVARVLRMRAGDTIKLFDGSGGEWPADIQSVERNAVIVTVGERFGPATEAALDVTVCQALVPADRMEYVIQKSTELGASKIIPVRTERVQARDADPGARRYERWRRIALEAVEQSGRVRVPQVLEPETFQECVTRLCAQGPVIVLWEEERGKSLRSAVQESLSNAPGRVAVLIGPVGGLSEAEADVARSAGAIIAGAGPRVLRAETAPVVALTALMYEAGELA